MQRWRGRVFVCMDRKEYSRKANGKFLITGEYMVLRGAEALALPLQQGQRILLVPNEGEAIYWEGFAPAGKWFETALHTDTLEVLAGADAEKSARLQNILREIRKQNSAFLTGGWWVRTDLDFDPTHGMGSSSTLLALLCDAAGVDPYPVLKNTFGGSGYDLACAFVQTPIRYTLTNESAHTETVSLAADVAKHILFVYSGNKMVSSGEVKKFSSLSIPPETVETFTGFTRQALAAIDHQTFAQIMRAHEEQLSQLLEQPVLQTRFPDFNGTVKSMGAWGGDFFMAIADDVETAKTYFESKGFGPVYRYSEIVLS